jgi:hypothetical protein
MLRVIARLVCAWVELRWNPRQTGLDYRAATYLFAASELYCALTREYWVRCHNERKSHA